VGEVKDDLRDLLTGARFVYCRDTISLDVVKHSGATPPVLEFAPDGAFGFHLRDEARAETYLAAQGLEAGKFVAAIPRLRYTPYHEIHHTQPTAEDRRRAQVTAEFRERDHAKLRDALVRFVRETGLKVLACPEMIHEVQVAKESLVDPLPEDVKAKVVWKDSYWLPDEAASVYARALGVVSFEMHSPIMAAAAGTPAIYLRQPTDTSKGQMWRDVGLSDWIFEIDDATGEDIARPLISFATDRAGCQARLAQAMAFVRDRQTASTAVVKEAAYSSR
jgi:polysaccharide pyruvyl transferase WcaK-like protein